MPSRKRRKPGEQAAETVGQVLADGSTAEAQYTTSIHCVRQRVTASCHLLNVHGVIGYGCPHSVLVRRGMVVQKEPDGYARYRQGLAPVSEKRDLQAFV